MPTNVDFFSMNEQADDLKIGTLSWDGERFHFLGDEKEILMKVVEEPETGPPPDGTDPETDPLGFLFELQNTYKSYMLRASEPYEGDPNP